ncbi:MAG: hypothetical protein HND57_08815 [Planctomycetes bacterium]|nr:hypothetical protein [Planctomycetota bacterium]
MSSTIPHHQNTHTLRSLAAMAIAGTVCLGSHAVAQEGGRPAFTMSVDWTQEEEGILANHVQLTFAKDFAKAGEAYFSPDAQWIIFQAVPAPFGDEEPDPFYSMYIARLLYDADGNITGLDRPKVISPIGSANTCGFFHPTIYGQVIFGTTIGVPSETTPPGFQRESSKYSWMFPSETEVVSRFCASLPAWRNQRGRIGENRSHLQLNNETDHEGYDAECAYSPGGRYIVYASMIDETNLCDLFIKDTVLKKTVPIVTAPGYDGGPFFSPDGQRICYRSDRKGDNVLKVYVAHLTFDEQGLPTGISDEYLLTEDPEVVNWAPFWHPSGKYLLYTSSAMGHFNYEAYLMDAAMPEDPDAEPTAYGTNKTRITHATGFDGLPVFSPDGEWMMWTSQRTDNPKMKGKSQIWAARFVLPLDGVDDAEAEAEVGPEAPASQPDAPNN